MEAELRQVPKLDWLECSLDLGGPLPSCVLGKPFPNLIIVEFAAAVSQIAFAEMKPLRSSGWRMLRNAPGARQKTLVSCKSQLIKTDAPGCAPNLCLPRALPHARVCCHTHSPPEPIANSPVCIHISIGPAPALFRAAGR